MFQLSENRRDAVDVQLNQTGRGQLNLVEKQSITEQTLGNIEAGHVQSDLRGGSELK